MSVLPRLYSNLATLIRQATSLQLTVRGDHVTLPASDLLSLAALTELAAGRQPHLLAEARF